MDFLFELIFDVILEGTIELSTSKKVPLIVRILLLMIVLLIYGGMIGIFVMIGLECWQRGDSAAAIFVYAIAAILAVLVVYMIRKKCKEK